MPRFSRGEALRFGWGVMKTNLGFFIQVLLVVFLVSFGPQVVSKLGQEKAIHLPGLVLYVLAIVFLILQVIVNFGLIRIALKFADGQKPKMRDLFETKNIVRYVAAGILYFLIIVGGVILLVVPGIIWGVKYQFYPYFIAGHNATAREAIRESGRITEGAKWDLFVFGIVVGLINLLGIVVFGIGLFATIPTTMVAAAYVFRKLQAGGQVVSAQAQISSSVNPPMP